MHRNKIVYRRYPVSDKATITYNWGWYYESGTHQYYSLFNTKSKITSITSYIWHLSVLFYLNDFTEEQFKEVAIYLADKENGFVTFFISDKKLNEMIEDVLTNGGEPPVNKKRKIIFKDYSGLTPNEKMSIVGKLVGRSSRVDGESIYQCMLDLNDMGKTITWSRIAGLLNCSTRTIQRNLNDTLKKEKAILNEEI